MPLKKEAPRSAQGFGSSSVRRGSEYAPETPSDQDQVAIRVATHANIPKVVGFSYADIDQDLAATIRTIAERIRTRIRKHTADIIETGRELAGIKLELAHGEFERWVEHELGLPIRTAQMYMRAAEFAVESGKSATVALLPPTTLHRLAAKSTRRKYETP